MFLIPELKNNSHYSQTATAMLIIWNSCFNEKRNKTCCALQHSALAVAPLSIRFIYLLQEKHSWMNKCNANDISNIAQPFIAILSFMELRKWAISWKCNGKEWFQSHADNPECVSAAPNILLPTLLNKAKQVLFFIYAAAYL